MTDPEELIDAVLRGYSNAEPSAAWEQRIFARTQRTRVGKWFALAPVLAFAAVVVFWIHRPAVVQPTPQVIARVENKEAPAIAPVSRAVARHARRTVLKEPIFPTPFPLTNDERALLSIAATEGPESDLFPIVDPSPLEISPIQIAALQKEN